MGKQQAEEKKVEKISKLEAFVNCGELATERIPFFILCGFTYLSFSGTS